MAVIPSAHVPGPCCREQHWLSCSQLLSGSVSTSIDALGMAMSEVRGVPAMCAPLSGTGEAHVLLCSHSTPSPCWRDIQREDGRHTASVSQPAITGAADHDPTCDASYHTYWLVYLSRDTTTIAGCGQGLGPLLFVCLGMMDEWVEERRRCLRTWCHYGHLGRV